MITSAKKARLQILRDTATRNRAEPIPRATRGSEITAARAFLEQFLFVAIVRQSSRPNKSCGKTSSSPRAARRRRAARWRLEDSRAETLSPRMPTMPTAMNHVTKLAKTQARAERDRSAMRAFRAGHTRDDRRQNQNAFQTLAKNENGNVEKRRSRAGVRSRRIGRPVRGNSLPDKHRNYAKCSYNDADAQSRLHFRSKFITCRRCCCRLIAFF